MAPHWSLNFPFSSSIQLSASYSFSTSCISCALATKCEGCNVNADILTTSGTSWQVDSNNPGTLIPYLLPYLHFTAYSVTSSSLVKGACVRQTISAVPLIDPYVVPVQSIATPYYSLGSYLHPDPSASTSEFSVFLDDKYSSLNAWLGYEGCTATLPPSPVVPPFVYYEEVSPTSAYPAPSAALPSATATESQVSVRHISTTQIIIVSTIVPIVGLATLVTCFIIIRRYRKKKGQAAGLDQTDLTSNTQLYIDRKAELGDEERRIHEMNAESLKYELEGEDRIFEIPSHRDSGGVLVSLQGTHEMGGIEHSQELEVPGIFP